tara:strand:+ start:3532 stop:3801 length:270 start_codon:yes stop_codon:yes gene_type:complete
MSNSKKVSISIRMPVDLHAQVHRIAGELSLENDSQLYRWIIEGFIEAVESSEKVPPMSPVLEIARKVHQSTGKVNGNGNGHTDPKVSAG